MRCYSDPSSHNLCYARRTTTREHKIDAGGRVQPNRAAPRSSLPELASLFSRCGLGQPRITSYDLLVELKDLLARAFPNPGDEAEIAVVFTAAAVDGRLGIPVRRESEAIYITYQAAILAASPAH